MVFFHFFVNSNLLTGAGSGPRNVTLSYSGEHVGPK